MQPKLLVAGKRITTPLGQYLKVGWAGENTSGIKPIGELILILPDMPAPQTAGGIHLTQQQIERDAHAAETGIIVAAGEAAFKWNRDRSRTYDGYKPEVGQRVWFERYAGSLQHGKDGVVYRLMDDKCIGAVAE